MVVSYAGEVCLLTMRHLIRICVDDIVVVEGRENAIGATLSVFGVVFLSWQEHASLVVSGGSLISYAGFVQTLESPGILLFRIPGPGKSWKKA